jgi:hypothetical protein
VNNPNCDGAGPHTSTVIRVYPLGEDGNLFLCVKCWAHENQYRYHMATIDPATHLRRAVPLHDLWPQHDWATAATAEVYDAKG